MAETKLTQEQALSVLISAAKVAQSKGAFSLEDASLIQKAISTFVPTKEQEDKSTAAKAQVVSEDTQMQPDAGTTVAEAKS